MRRSRRLILVGILLASTGCAKSAPDDHAQVMAAIEKLRSGKTISEIENVSALASQLASAPSHGSSQAPSARPAVPTAELGPDPCARVSKPGKNASTDQMHTVLMELVGCWQDLLSDVDTYSAAMDYFKAYTLREGSKPFSEMSLAEISDFADRHSAPIQDVLVRRPEKFQEVRTRFSNDDLAELVRLEKIKTDRAISIEKGIFASMDARPELMNYATSVSSRYLAMLAMRNAFQSPDYAHGWTSYNALRPLLPQLKLKDPSQFLSAYLLNPYGLIALVPTQDRPHPTPFAATDDEEENYFATPDPESSDTILKAYAELRDHDDPPIPPHPAAAPDAVRLAVLDTGIDFIRFPELGLFLGSGSADFAGLDTNPYIPSLAPFHKGIETDYEWWHGSATTGTILTVLAHFAPETLAERRLDLSVWKDRTIKEALGDLHPKDVENWSDDYFFPGIYHRIADPGVKPQIVSASLGLGDFPSFLKGYGAQDLLKKAPWLWVMAAGNDGKPLSANMDIVDCFLDIAPENKIDENVLCVGALHQGMIQDQIAYYSNFGPRVDVYAEESYFPLCPSGTSCSTPAVTAAAVVIQAHYPKLTPAQIRRVIIDAAEDRELEVEADPDAPSPAPVVKRTVRVFDPPSMLEKALALAAKIAT